MQKFIKKENIKELTQNLLKENICYGSLIFKDQLVYKQLFTSDDLKINNDCTVKPVNSIKEVFFPRTEVIVNYEVKEKQVVPKSPDIKINPTVVIGVKPCDAHSLTILDHVFSWDYKDSTFLERRDSTTVISIACKNMEEPCFCTWVDGMPDSNKGTDILLTETTDEKGYIATTHSQKGESLLNKYSNLFEEVGSYQPKKTEIKVNKEEIADVKRWLIKNFEDDIWKTISKKCIGCAACTFTCPTCHCFDIVDETSMLHGNRRKNWDSCMFPLFTKMPVHQPRPDQYRRWRQRLNHKFNYYPERFGVISCVGCGRCVTVCPVNQDIREMLLEIKELAKSEGK